MKKYRNDTEYVMRKCASEKEPRTKASEIRPLRMTFGAINMFARVRKYLGRVGLSRNIDMSVGCNIVKSTDDGYTNNIYW